MEFSENQQKAVRYLASCYEAEEAPSRQSMAQACGIGIDEATPIFALMERLGFLETPAKPTNATLTAFLPDEPPRATERVVRMAQELERRSGRIPTPTTRNEGLPLAWKIILGVIIFKAIFMLIVMSIKSA